MLVENPKVDMRIHRVNRPKAVSARLLKKGGLQLCAV